MTKSGSRCDELDELADPASQVGGYSSFGLFKERGLTTGEDTVITLYGTWDMKLVSLDIETTQPHVLALLAR